MSEAANKIETARREYVAALGTADERAKRRELEKQIEAARAAQPRTSR